MNKASVLMATLLALPGVASATVTFTTEVTVAGKGVISLDRPTAWEATVGGPDFGPTLRLRPKGGAGFSVLVTAMARSSEEAMPAEELESGVRLQGQRLLPTAVQSQLEVVRVSGAQSRGFLYHLTDRKPESGPGDYREMRQGTVEVGPVLLSVTILTHTGDTETVDDALAMLATARFSAPAATR
jgi:hypothetical protein